MINLKNLFFVCLLVICCFACTKDDDGTQQEGPICISDLIAQLEAEPVRNPPGKIYSYKFEGKTVYYLSADCCDQFSTLLSATCDTICAPDGGIIGTGDGLCPDFFKDRKDEKLIWEDKR